HLAPRRHVPDLDAPVRAHRGQALAIRMPRQGQDRLPRLAQGPHPLAFDAIPDRYYPVLPGGGQLPSVPAPTPRRPPSSPPHGPPRQAVEFLAGAGVPDLDPSVRPPDGQPLTFRVPRQRTHPARRLP